MMTFIALFFIWFQTDTLENIIVDSYNQLFHSAVSISSTTEGKLLVVDQELHSLFIIAANNTIEKTIGGKGWGNEAFDLPSDVSSSFVLNVFVVDKNNRRIQRFDKQLQYVQTIDENSSESFGTFQPVACSPSTQGDLFILDSDGKRVIKLNSRGQFEKEFGTYKESTNKITDPKDIAVSQNNVVCVLDRSGVLLFDIYGNYLQTIQFDTRDDWNAINVSDNLLIVTSPQMIIIINLQSMQQKTILPHSLLGLKVHEPFTGALLQNSHLVILTKTSLYRCSFSE